MTRHQCGLRHQRRQHRDRHADHHPAGRHRHAERGRRLQRHPDADSGRRLDSYTLTGTGADITAELDQLVFTPDPTGNPNGSVTTTFELSDLSQAGGASNTDSTSQVTDTDSPVAPSISNASAPHDLDQTNPPASPFAGRHGERPNAAAGSNAGSTATDTLTIALLGGTGTLSDAAGFSGGTLALQSDGSYTLTGTGAEITTELEQLVFTPGPGRAQQRHHDDLPVERCVAGRRPQQHR